MQELLQQFKVMVGLSSDDPPDSEWIKMEKTDRSTGKKVRKSSRRGLVLTCCGGVAVASRHHTSVGLWLVLTCAC